MRKDCLMMNRIKLVVNVYLHVACFSMNEIRWILYILDAKIAVFNLFYLPILLYDCQKIVYQNKKIRNKSVAARTLVLTDALSTILAYLFSHRFLPRFSKLRPATYWRLRRYKCLSLRTWAEMRMWLRSVETIRRAWRKIGSLDPNHRILK